MPNLSFTFNLTFVGLDTIEHIIQLMPAFFEEDFLHEHFESFRVLAHGLVELIKLASMNLELD